MKVDDKIKQRLHALAELGAAVLRSEHSDSNGQRWVDEGLTAGWIASARNLLSSVFGDDSAYFDTFAEYTSGFVAPMQAKQGHGVVLAAQADYVANGIFNVRQLVEAEVFDDFLEQAGHLLTSGYFQPAAVVIGCVLEDAMRKLCGKHGIALPAEPKLDWMNAELAKKGVYNKLVQKDVTAKSDLRNKAAHGKWAEFKREDVDAMLPWLRRFLVDYGG